jgi:hypothetical protein
VVTVTSKNFFIIISSIPAFFITGMFFFRAPVLIVTDEQFNILYGKNRLISQCIETSIALWRPVRLVLVAENAEPDMVAFAIEFAAPSPFCVLVPYRYKEGAERYAEQFPATKTIVLDGRMNTSADGKVPVVSTDFTTDLYRAGQCAALFAGEQQKQSSVLVFQDEALSQEQRNAFTAGLVQQGFEQSPIFISEASSYSSQDIACAVIIGVSQIDIFFEHNPTVPVILFSWIDPSATSRQIKIIFEDSPLVPVKQVVDQIREQKSLVVFSHSIILRQRISQKGLFIKLKNAVHSTVL